MPKKSKVKLKTKLEAKLTDYRITKGLDDLVFLCRCSFNPKADELMELINNAQDFWKEEN